MRRSSFCRKTNTDSESSTSLKPLTNDQKTANTKNLELEDIARDGRKIQMFKIAGLLFIISVAIMILSIVANDNFGKEHEEVFQLKTESEMEKNDMVKQFRNNQVVHDGKVIQPPGQSSIDKNDEKEKLFNEKGYQILKQCRMPRYFTQGIEVLDSSTLMISSGWYGISKLVLLKYDFETCELKEIYSSQIEERFFGEGLTLSNENKIYYLTYTSNKILVWDLNQTTDNDKRTYAPVLNSTLDMPKDNKLTQGWGIAYKFDKITQKHLLYATDGSNYIYVIDIKNWQQIDQIAISDQSNHPLFKINELDIIKTMPSSLTGLKENVDISDYVFANQFTRNFIYLINLKTGKVVKKWDLSELHQEQHQFIANQGGEPSYDWNNNVLNGIAYDKYTDTFIFTGKRWDLAFKVKLNYKDYIV